MSLLVVLTRPTPSYFSFVLTVINNFKWLVAVLEKWIGQNPHVNARWGCLKRQVAWDFLCFPFLDGGIYTNKFTWSEAIDYLVFGKRELALTTKNVGGDQVWFWYDTLQLCQGSTCPINPQADHGAKQNNYLDEFLTEPRSQHMNLLHENSGWSGLGLSVTPIDYQTNIFGFGFFHWKPFFTLVLSCL